MKHTFQLTELEDQTLDLLYSEGFPNPTLRQIAGWSTFGPGGATDTADDAGRKNQARAVLDVLVNKGLCERRGDRHYPTELAEAYRAYRMRERVLRAVAYDLEDRISRLGRDKREVERTLARLLTRIEETS